MPAASPSQVADVSVEDAPCTAPARPPAARTIPPAERNATAIPTPQSEHLLPTVNGRLIGQAMGINSQASGVDGTVRRHSRGTPDLDRYGSGTCPRVSPVGFICGRARAPPSRRSRPGWFLVKGSRRSAAECGTALVPPVDPWPVVIVCRHYWRKVSRRKLRDLPGTGASSRRSRAPLCCAGHAPAPSSDCRVRPPPPSTVPAGRSGSARAARTSVPWVPALGASPFASGSKASSNWMFRRLARMSGPSY